MKVYEVCDYRVSSTIGYLRMEEALAREMEEREIVYFVEREVPDSDSLPEIGSDVELDRWLLQ